VSAATATALGTTRLSLDQARALEVMRREAATAPMPFTPSRLWREVLALFDQLFKTEGITNPEHQYFNDRFSRFEVDHRLHRYACWMYRSLLVSRDSLGLLGSLNATCKEEHLFGYHMEGQLVSTDLLLSLDDFYSLYELNAAIATEPLVVADLGAGWGRLGYVLQKVNPRCIYVVFDLPEPLVISQSYLPTLLPEVPVRRYEQCRHVARFDREILQAAPMWFLGAQDLLKFDAASVDLIVKTGSFQEMPATYVAEYFRHFSHVAAGGHCFLRQLRRGNSHGHRWDEIPGLDDYPFPANWGRQFLRSATFSDESFEAGFSIPPRIEQFQRTTRRGL
jgi:putative sugar O-methyltransferase